MSYTLINVDKLLYLSECSGASTQAKLAEAAGVDKKTVWNVLNRGRASVEVRKRLARAVGLGVNDHELLVAPSAVSIAGLSGAPSHVDNLDEEMTTIIAGPLELGRDLQDIKLVLRSEQLSQSMIVGRQLPTFAECIRSTCVWTPTDDGHKDHAALPGWMYNHFVHLSLLVTLDARDGSNVLAYLRQKRSRSPGHVHTTGLSILFGSSPLWNVVRHGQTGVDAWLNSAVDAKGARCRFLEGAAPAVLLFARYKIDLVGTKCKISPLGIITRDERSAGCRRIHTHFVFHVVVKVDERNVDRFVRRIPTDGASLSRIADNIDAEKLFVGANGRVNEMDVVAWDALHSGQHEELTYGQARFRRGFEVI